MPDRKRIERLLGGRRAIVVGVGNRLRGDDGVGSCIARDLIARGCSGVLDAETVPENYLGPLLEAGPEVVLFVDAADFGGTPGECCIAPVSGLAGRGAATHAASLALLDIVLGPSGIECWLLGIQPRATAFGGEVTDDVRETANEIEEALAASLAGGGEP